MQLKSKLLAIVLAACCAHTTMASAMTIAPATCPNVAAIKAVGITDIASAYIVWAGVAKDYYGTDSLWSFMVILQDQAIVDKADALRIANTRISRLKLIRGPEQNKNEWVCYYAAPGVIEAAAFTPPADYRSAIAGLLAKTKNR